MEADDIANHYAAVARHYQVLPGTEKKPKMLFQILGASIVDMKCRGLSTPTLQTVSTNRKWQHFAKNTLIYDPIIFLWTLLVSQAHPVYKGLFSLFFYAVIFYMENSSILKSKRWHWGTWSIHCLHSQVDQACAVR